MRLVYEPASPMQSVSYKSIIITIVASVIVIIAAILTWIIYSDKAAIQEPVMQETAIITEEDTPAADNETAEQVQEETILEPEPESKYLNIEGAHNLTNFEYLIKEIGDNTN